MKPGSQFRCMRDGLTLIATMESSGQWSAAVRDNSADPPKFILRPNENHDTAEQAKHHAQRFAENQLGRPLPDLEWKVSESPLPHESKTPASTLPAGDAKDGPLKP